MSISATGEDPPGLTLDELTEYWYPELTDYVQSKVLTLEIETTKKFVALGTTVQNWFTGITGEIRDWLETPLGDIESAINLVWDTLTKFKESIKSTVETIMANTVGYFDTAMGKIKGVFDDVWGRMETIILTVKDTVNSLKDTVINAINLTITTVKEWLKDLWESMDTGLTFIGNQVAAAIKSVVDQGIAIIANVSSYIQASYRNMRDEIVKVYDRGVLRLEGFIDIAKEGFGEFIDRIVEILTAIWDWIKDLLGDFKDLPFNVIEDLMYQMVKVQQKVGERLMADKGA